MDRLDDLKKIIQLYEMHAVVDRGRDSENVQAPLSSFLEVAVRGSVSARRNEAVLARMSKLCERKEFTNDPSNEISELSSTFQRQVNLVNQDLALLKKMLEERVASAQALQHNKIIVDGFAKQLSTQVNSFKRYAENHAENLRQRQERVAQYGQVDANIRHLERQQQQYAMFSDTRVTQSAPNHGVASKGNALRRRTHALASAESGYITSAPALEEEAKHQRLEQETLSSNRRYKENRLSNAQRIESTIAQMGEMFTQLSSLVLQQSETITRIEDDVEVGLQETTKAHEHMQRFYEISKGNRSLILKIFALLIFFIFMFLYFT